MPFLSGIETDHHESKVLSLTQSFSPTLMATETRINQFKHEDGPEHQFQINQDLLYENEFHGSTYVSAHLQRLQNGIFAHDNMHTKIPMHVTFVAVTFTFHPSISVNHRFTQAVVEITANDLENGEHGKLLRFIKYAPHLAYGRISTESLKWSFQLGAALGVTQGPVTLGVNSNARQDRERTQEAMMKIQGSTRSTRHASGVNFKHERLPDTKLVWSLEENDQQQTGLPREFTFVFLVERPSRSMPKPKHGHHFRTNRDDENGEFHSDAETRPVHNAVVTESHAHHDADLYAHVDHNTTFGPFSLGITVKPNISGPMSKIQMSETHEDTEVDKEVGQKLLAEHTSDSGVNGRVNSFSTMEGYFNFANMKQDFEGLIELPGNTITTMEPELPEK